MTGDNPQQSSQWARESSGSRPGGFCRPRKAGRSQLYLSHSATEVWRTLQPASKDTLRKSEAMSPPPSNGKPLPLWKSFGCSAFAACTAEVSDRNCTKNQLSRLWPLPPGSSSSATLESTSAKCLTRPRNPLCPSLVDNL